MDTVYLDSASREQWQKIIYPALPVLDYFIPSQPEAKAITGLSDPCDIANQYRRALVALDDQFLDVFLPAHARRVETVRPGFRERDQCIFFVCRQRIPADRAY